MGLSIVVSQLMQAISKWRPATKRPFCRQLLQYNAFSCPEAAPKQVSNSSAVRIRPANKQDLAAMAAIQRLSQGYWVEKELKVRHKSKAEILVSGATKYRVCRRHV